MLHGHLGQVGCNLQSLKCLSCIEFILALSGQIFVLYGQGIELNWITFCVQLAEKPSGKEE